MSKKIMLVDDAAFMRMMIKNTLNQNGFTDIIEAKNGEEAVALAKTENPDLIVLDITMPIKSGLEALQEIKADNANVKVVMCSAMGQENMVLEALKLGAEDFIVKPFKPDRVMKTINNILG